MKLSILIVVVVLVCPFWLSVTPWTVACQASTSFTISQNLLKLMSIEPVMPSNHLILCRPLLFLPSIFPSIRVFSSESALHIRWPKYWSFSIGISSSSEYSRLIYFRIDWFDLVVQGVFRYFNMSMPPSRVFWFGKKEESDDTIMHLDCKLLEVGMWARPPDSSRPLKWCLYTSYFLYRQLSFEALPAEHFTLKW